MTIEERFWSKVKKTETCWLWKASFRPTGYGQFLLYGKVVAPHRVAWLLAFGPIPAHLQVCHTCDVRACCRPDHLFLGTREENMQDAKRKGRTAKGERNGHALLTVKQVRQIRAAFNLGASQSHLAEQFGVTRSNIATITQGRSWKHA